MTDKKKSPKRTTRKFQLRVEHPVDSHVLEILNYAKSQRQEVTVIREAVVLYWALKNGNLDALFETFPQYKGQMGGGAGLEEIKKLLVSTRVENGTGLQIRLPAPEAPKAIAEDIYVDVAASADMFMNAFT